MDYTEKKIKTVNRYEGIIVDVQVDRVQLTNGAETMREVVGHPGGVTVLPIDDDGNVYCVTQYRYPFGEMLLEVPAGKLEKGENHHNCAVRELSEETGIQADRLDYLGEIFLSPGFCREVLYLYLARGLHFGTAHPDENEFLNVVKLPLSELVEKVMDGSIRDAKTIIAVLKAEKLWKEQR